MLDMGFSVIHGFRHPLPVLECTPMDKGGPLYFLILLRTSSVTLNKLFKLLVPPLSQL